MVILGSTGSIGTQALEVVGERRDDFRVTALAAGGSDTDLLARQILDHDPDVVAVARPTVVQDLQLALYAQAQQRGWNRGDVRLPRITAGPDAAGEVAALPCDVVLNGITGAAGLDATLATLAAGTTLALANKESLVIGGSLVTDAAAPGQLVPVDSEHSAIAQCLRAGRRDEVSRIILTASGGPFRGRSRDELVSVTPEQAMQHPTWSMGRVVTINSATLMNKGLELLEAGLLFNMPLDDVHVTVHPQSIVHSMVEFIDGSTIVQASPPSMKIPIALGLSWPGRVTAADVPCDWTTAAAWTFEPLDDEAFPAVRLARRVGKAAGTAPAVYTGANEVLVDAFCDGRIGFCDIVDTVSRIVDEHLGDAPEHTTAPGPTPDLHLPGARHTEEHTRDDVLAADAWARHRAGELTGTAQGAAGENTRK